MRKQALEMALQKLKPYSMRDPRLEQYPTPAVIAADVIWEAFSAGDVGGRSVVDLGCGNGVFCIGAKLMGAARSVGIDVDPAAVKVARENAALVGCDVEVAEGDVRSFEGSFDTVLENPPFGAQTRHADRAFVKAALGLAPVVYSIHNGGTEEFVGKLVQALGGRSTPVKRYKFEIPYAFEFHRKTKEEISVVLFKFER